MRLIALVAAGVLLAGGAGAQTKEGQPDANFTQMPIEQEGTSHGTPRDNGPAPEGDGSLVVRQGTGTGNAPSTPAKPCDPASTNCPGADVAK
jgi:hypothetical protein